MKKAFYKEQEAEQDCIAKDIAVDTVDYINTYKSFSNRLYAQLRGSKCLFKVHSEVDQCSLISLLESKLSKDLYELVDIEFKGAITPLTFYITSTDEEE